MEQKVTVPHRDTRHGARYGRITLVAGWVVAVDGKLYERLGRRAAARPEEHDGSLCEGADCGTSTTCVDETRCSNRRG